MAGPSNSTVNIQAAVEKKLAALRELCETYAYQNAQNFAQEHASKNSAESAKPAKQGAKSREQQPPVAMTAKMLAEAEKTKTMSQREAWINRTHDAAKKLKGYVIDDGESLGWGIMHRTEYGKALEYAFDGRYAILRPAVEHYRAKFFEQVREIMGDKA